VILFFYVLSLGPVWRFSDAYNGHPKLEKALGAIYTPLLWTYERTPLRRPLGMYLHLWMPKDFDKDGEIHLQL
jgi:hypothetical protein